MLIANILLIVLMIQKFFQSNRSKSFQAYRMLQRTAV